MTKKQTILVALFLIISALTFTNLVTPYNVTEPWLFSMPRTLWAGILISILLAFLTLIAAFTIKADDAENEKLTDNDTDKKDSLK